MNSVNIIGNIGHDLELRHTGSGKSVLNFNIAVNDFRGETEWFRIVLWDKLATNTVNYCSKGSKIGITGRLSINKYTNKDGIEVEQVEIVGLAVEFLSHKDDAKQNNYQQSNNKSNNKSKPEDNPFENIAFENSANEDPTDISDDDLPF